MGNSGFEPWCLDLNFFSTFGWLSAWCGKFPTPAFSVLLSDSTVSTWKPYHENMLDLSRPSSGNVGPQGNTPILFISQGKLTRMFDAAQLLESFYLEVRHQVGAAFSLPGSEPGPRTEHVRPGHLFFSCLTFGFEAEWGPFWTWSHNSSLHPGYKSSISVFWA